MDKPAPSVYAKLITARMLLQSQQINKSGHNKFAGYKYFELADFLPSVQEIFCKVGLVDIIQFTADTATMHLVDTEDGSSVVFTSPMGSAQLKGCHEVQNIGAVETYQRRYLYVTAMAIVEHDALDATTGSEPEKAKAKPKAEPAPAPAPKDPVKIEGKDEPWQLKVEDVDGVSWQDAVHKATDTALTFANTTDDVLSIFKVNRNIYDKLKVEAKDVYDEIMDKFKKQKESLTKE